MLWSVGVVPAKAGDFDVDRGGRLLRRHGIGDRLGLRRRRASGRQRQICDGLGRQANRFALPPHASPQYRHISRDGAIRVDLDAQEWSNANWVNAPRVIEIASGRILLDLWGTDWDATVSFRELGHVRLDCRRAHVGGALSVVLDLGRGCYQISLAPALGGVLPEQPLNDIAAGLEAASRRGELERQAVVILPHPLAAWSTALLILIVALVLIGIVAFVSTRQGGLGWSH